MSSVRVEAISTDIQAVPFQETSLDIWDKKYRLKSKIGESIDSNIDDTYKRVARAISMVEKTKELREKWNESFLWALRRGAIPDRPNVASRPESFVKAKLVPPLV